LENPLESFREKLSLLLSVKILNSPLIFVALQATADVGSVILRPLLEPIPVVGEGFANRNRSHEIGRLLHSLQINPLKLSSQLAQNCAGYQDAITNIFLKALEEILPGNSNPEIFDPLAQETGEGTLTPGEAAWVMSSLPNDDSQHQGGVFNAPADGADMVKTESQRNDAMKRNQTAGRL
jgi:hypothetical protein